MIVLMALGMTIAALSLIAFISKRRFGTLGLALAGGYLIAESTAQQAGLILLNEGISLGVISVQTLSMMVITLLPSLLLFFGGPTYSTRRGRLFGSLLYALLALALCLGAIGHSLVLMGQERMIFDMVWQYREQAVVVLLIVAMIDMFMTHTITKAVKTK